jgi:hypothetical protein
MHEQAELTASTSPPQFPKSVGMAFAAVMVAESHLGQKDLASAANRTSVISLKQLSGSCSSEVSRHPISYSRRSTYTLRELPGTGCANNEGS